MLNPETLEVSLPSDFSFMCLTFPSAISMVQSIGLGDRKVEKVQLGLFLQAGLEYAIRLMTTGANRDQIFQELDRTVEVLCSEPTSEVTKCLESLKNAFIAVFKADSKSQRELEYVHEEWKYKISL